MKRYWKLVLMSYVLLIILLVLPALLHAQPDPAGPDPDPDAPIDGGLAFLIAAGVGYGLNKIRRDKKRKNSTV